MNKSSQKIEEGPRHSADCSELSMRTDRAKSQSQQKEEGCSTPKRKLNAHQNPQSCENYKEFSDNENDKLPQTSIKKKPKKNKKDRNAQHPNKSVAQENLEYSLELNNIIKSLDMLTLPEKKDALRINEKLLCLNIKKEVECQGCAVQIQEFISDIMKIASLKNKYLSLDNYEGFMVFPNQTIGISDILFDNNKKIGQVLLHHKNNSNHQDIMRNFSVKKIPQAGGAFKNKKNYRCMLHSKKAMPNYIWKESLQNILEHNQTDLTELTEIDEEIFHINLQNYMKKRKFCTTCKENILCSYEHIKENAESPEDYLDEEIEEEEEEEEEEEQGNLSGDEVERSTCQEHEREELYQRANSQQHHSMLQHHHMQQVQQQNSQPHQHVATHQHHQQQSARNIDVNMEKCPCECHYDHEAECHCSCNEEFSKNSEISCEEGFSNMNGDLISTIKYSRQRKRLYLPLQLEAITEVLTKASDFDTTFQFQVKHASTKEAAQEELLICLGLTLKDKLQTLWKTKKSNTIVRLYFLKICASSLIENLSILVQRKLEKMGHKTVIEEYLKEEEVINEMKKEKNKKKRIRKKEKKKQKKMNDKSSVTEGGGSKEDYELFVEDENFTQTNKIYQLLRNQEEESLSKSQKDNSQNSCSSTVDTEDNKENKIHFKNRLFMDCTIEPNKHPGGTGHQIVHQPQRSQKVEEAKVVSNKPKTPSDSTASSQNNENHSKKEKEKGTANVQHQAQASNKNASLKMPNGKPQHQLNAATEEASAGKKEHQQIVPTAASSSNTNVRSLSSSDRKTQIIYPSASTSTQNKLNNGVALKKEQASSTARKNSAQEFSEKEKQLLDSMGWNDDELDENTEGHSEDELMKEIKETQWKELCAKREHERKNLEEKFKSFLKNPIK